MAPGKKRGRSSSSSIAAVEWSVGDLVLAKVKGFPAWPAQVSKPEAFGQQQKPSRVFVVFFGTKEIRFCQHSEISRFTPEARALLIAKAHSKCTPAGLRLAVSEICDIAERVELDGDSGDTSSRSKAECKELIEDGEASCVMDLGLKVNDVEEQAGNGGASEVDDYELGWGSGSSLDGNSDDDTTRGIVLHEKVQTNFASHEELDAFESFDCFNEEVVNVPAPVQVGRRKNAKSEKPAKQRTPRSKKAAANANANANAISPPVIPANFCRKKRKQTTVKATTPRGVARKEDRFVQDNVQDNVHSEDDPSAPSPNESQEQTFRRKVTLKKRLRPTFESRSAGTESDHNVDKADTPNETSPITQDPDSNLPIVKRARARAAKEAAVDRFRDEDGKQSPVSIAATPACNGSDPVRLIEEKPSDGKDSKPKPDEKYTGLILPPKAEKYRMRNSADSEAALPPSKRRHRALEAMTACVAEAAKEEETAKAEDPKVESGNETGSNCAAAAAAADADDDVGKLQSASAASPKEFVDKEVDPASVGLDERVQKLEAVLTSSIEVSVEAEATRDRDSTEVVEVAEELLVKFGDSNEPVVESGSGIEKVDEQQPEAAAPDLDSEPVANRDEFGFKEQDDATEPVSGHGEARTAAVMDNPDPEPKSPLSPGLSPVSMEVSDDGKAGIQELDSKAGSDTKVSSPVEMQYSPVSPTADDYQVPPRFNSDSDKLNSDSERVNSDSERFNSDSVAAVAEPDTKAQSDLQEDRQQGKTSPSAWWGRPSHLSKFHDRRKLETHLDLPLPPKDDVRRSSSPATSIRYSPVSPTIRDEGNTVMSEHTVTVKSSGAKIETTMRTNRYSSKAGNVEAVVATKTRVLQTPKSSKMNKRHSPSRLGAETSSLVSERETTESHSGESLASENEHTSARTKTTESSLRMTKSAELLKANDAKIPSDNKVRVAYEAAKELKQKLASKDGETSTSKKYIMETIQSKVPGAALLPSKIEPEIVADQGIDLSKDLAALANGNDEVETARMIFEGLLDSLSRAKESIHCATRQAIDCAKLNLADQVIDIIAKRLEVEQSFSRRIDLFFLVDSITVTSHNLRGTPAGVYRHIVHNALPRLLSAAAPPGNFARENRRQCLKVFKLWHERNVFPPSVIRHFMREIELHNCDRVLMNMSRRPARNERPVDDPIREIEGMQVDEYGSNASFTLPGVSIPPMIDGDEEAKEAIANEDYAAVAAAPLERHRHVLEDVDGELEMEDVSPETDTWQRQYVSPASILAGPPLPVCPPPSTPPPLPSSPPPSTPPPPPPPGGAPYLESFSPGYHAQQSIPPPPPPQPYNGGEAYDHYHPGVYGDEGYPAMPVDNGYNSYAGFSDVPPHPPVSPQYGGHQQQQQQHHPYPYPTDGHTYQGEYPYQPYAETWSEPSPRSRYAHNAADDHYYNSHHDGYGDHGSEYYHQNGHYGQSHHDGGGGYSSHARYSSGYVSPSADHQTHTGHGSSGRSSRRHGHYSHDAGGGYSHDYDGGYSHSRSRSHSREGGRDGGYSHSSHDGGGGGSGGGNGGSGGGNGSGSGGGYSSHNHHHRHHQEGYSHGNW